VLDWRRGVYGGTSIPGWTADKTYPHGGTTLTKYPGKKSKAEVKEKAVPGRYLGPSFTQHLSTRTMRRT